jgi:hypothetical protein
MPTDQNNKPGQAEKNENNILGTITLLALPWLSFQRNILEVMKGGIQDASSTKPFKTLALHELHALMMILDPSGKWRNTAGADLEKKVEDTCNEAIAKISSGSINFIEAQQDLITSLINTLNKERTGSPSRDDRG